MRNKRKEVSLSTMLKDPFVKVTTHIIIVITAIYIIVAKLNLKIQNPKSISINTEIKIVPRSVYIVDIFSIMEEITPFFQQLNLFINNIKNQSKYHFETAIIDDVYNKIKNSGLKYNFSEGIIKKLDFPMSPGQYNLLLFFDTLERFLTTSYEWYLRISPNTYLNSDNLDKFIIDLRQKYNPIMDPVMKGAVNDKTIQRYVFLESGLLLSRKAAEEILIKNQFMKLKWVVDKKEEKLSTIEFMDSITQPYFAVHTSRFIPIRVNHQEIQQLMIKDYNQPGCPSFVFDGETTVSGVPLSKLVTITFETAPFSMFDFDHALSNRQNYHFIATAPQLQTSYICRSQSITSESWIDSYL